MQSKYRPYVCTVCGYKDKIKTNHAGTVLHYCNGCSKTPKSVNEQKYTIPKLQDYRQFKLDMSINENKTASTGKFDKIKKLLKGGKLTEEQKRKILHSLKSIKESGGNIGGTTDIQNQDNLQVNEDEFTAAIKPERNVIAKTFETHADFDSYVNQRRGIEMTSKELQALLTEQSPSQTPAPQPDQSSNNQETDGQPEDITVDDSIRITKSITFTEDTEGADILADLIEDLELQKAKPTQQDKFFVKYEMTDAFGKNETTIIKKLKEGNQFCWTAFSKYESAEEDSNPADDGGSDKMGGNEDSGPDMGDLK